MVEENLNMHRLFKHDFRCNKVMSPLNMESTILEQEGVVVQYQDDYVVKTVPAKHGIITVFEIDSDYYVLGTKVVDPYENRGFELQASIGGTNPANTSVPLKSSLGDELASASESHLDLNDFQLSTSYVCHRSPDWGEWSVCYLKIIGLFNNITSMDTLIETVSSINAASRFSYAIYDLKTIIYASKKTAGITENRESLKSHIYNHYTHETEIMNIFDDNAVANLFTAMSIEKLFPDKQCFRHVNK